MDYRFHDEDAAAYLKYIRPYTEETMPAPIRTFATGATRDADTGKHDYEGYLSPLVIRRFGEYMTKHRVQADGSVRASDNWQKGIPQQEYIKSAWRHFVDWWLWHRGHAGKELLEDALCGLLFNVAGYLHERLARSMKTPEGEGRVRPAGFTAKLDKRVELYDLPL